MFISKENEDNQSFLRADSTETISLLEQLIIISSELTRDVFLRQKQEVLPRENQDLTEL